MYSRNQHRGREFRLPEHYSGVAFDRAHPLAPQPPTYCADGLPPSSAPPMQPPPQPEPSAPETCTEKAPPTLAARGEGLFGGIGGEELLLIGIILLLAGRPGEDDTILLLLLLLLRH